MPEDHQRQVLQWIKNGPTGSDGTLGWIIAMTLWWRVWGISFAFLAGFFLNSAIVYQYGETSFPAVYAIGLIVGGWVLRISPKYNVEKEY